MTSRLSKFGVKFPFMVGPMVGITHAPFRELVRSYLPADVNALLFTEMLSTRRLPSELLDKAQMLRVSENESFFIPQILGNEERFIAPSIEKLMRRSPWGIDINMGCPTSHTLKHNWGVLLMGDKNYAAEVVRITKRHSPVPVSVKLRSGTEGSSDVDYLDEFTKALEEAGADWITLHCRPRGQGHRGTADWNAVAEIARRRKIPVVANGDIQNADDALTLLQERGVDGAMIGRAATARPWILGQIAKKLGIGEGPTALPVPMSLEEESQAYFVACWRLLANLESHFDEPYALKKFHFFVVTGSRWFMFGHNFWKTTMRAKSLAQARDLISEYQEKYSHPISSRVHFS